jgi:hypothetical protein
VSQGEKGGTREGPFNNRPDSGPEERRLWLASSLGALPESSARIESLASLSAVGLGGPVVVVRVATAKGLGLFFGAIAGSPHGFAVIGGCSNVLFPDLGLGIPVA